MAKGRHQVDPRVIWVREKHDDSPNCHYHCLALVNGNAKQSSYDIHKRAEKQWGNALGLKKVQGLVDYCDKRGEASIMIDRNQPDYESKLAAAQEQASYLSKSRGKENKPYNLWQVGGTRVPEASKRD
ncbi:hypothetical protein FACS189460_0950 [Deltaproteobacteria bacterium]|nr:hypothetical protein FACS189460_0950 [Deltaproteobacteria bacterium]